MASASALEAEIAQMEQRLASVKVTVDVEREAWQRAARTGKRGTKWRSAAVLRDDTGPVPTAAAGDDKQRRDGNEEPELTVMPTFWDPLELAQFLQSRHLPRFAQIIVSEQITGKLLLDTSPGRLRLLLSVADVGDKNPDWKAFLRACSYLHKQQKRLERISSDALNSARSDGSDKKSKRGKLTASISNGRSDAVVFPLISPRGIVGSSATGIKASNNAAKPESIAPKRQGTFAQLRKAATQSSTSTNGLHMSTCWSCGARFIRTIPPPTAIAGTTKAASLKALLSARPYCSKQCRERIERSDMSVTPALSVSLQPVEDARTSKSSSPPGGSKPTRPPATAPKINDPMNDSSSRIPTRVPISVVINTPILREVDDEPLQLAVSKLAQPEHSRPTPPSTTGSLAPPANCPSPTTQRMRPSKTHRGLATAQASFGSTQRSVASIPWTNHSVSGAISTSTNLGTLAPNAASMSVGNSSAATAQSRVYQQSRYKLDPEVFQANRLTLSVVFGGFTSGNQTANSSTHYARSNLLKLQDFLSVRALYRLSLTSHAWHALITQPSALSDALWGVHVLRTWRQSEEDEELLHQIGVMPKPERPRRMLMKLTKQVARVALENLKVLLSPETWQLATVMTESDVTLAHNLASVLSSRRRRRLGSPPPSPRQPKQLAVGPAELYESISVIYNTSCEIVAVKAQQLLRPLDEKGASLTSVLQGLQRGELRDVRCRRLRLFSAANRLPFELWPLLPTTRAVFELFWSEQPDLLPVWHQKTLTKLQASMQQRLLGKDSVQQVMRSLQERNGPPEVLIALEKFLIAAHGSAGVAPRSPRARAVGEL